MKWNKKFFAVVTAAMMAFGVAGCGGSTGGDTTDVEALITKAQETMAEVNSMRSVMTMDMAMSAGEESVEFTTEASIIAMDAPMKMQMDISVSMGEEIMQDMQMFAEEVEGQMIAYMNLGDTWYAVPMDISELEQYNAEENMSLYLDNITSFSAAGQEDINGVQATKITGVITGDAMEEAIASSGAMDSMASMGISQEEIEAMYAELGDLPISLWIDADGYVVKYEMDMSGMMQAIMDKAMSTVAEETDEDTSIQVQKVMVTMVSSDFNGITDIEIPAEALEAEVMQ